MQKCLHINKYRCFKYDDVVVKFFAGKSQTFSITKHLQFHEGINFKELAKSHEILKHYCDVIDKMIQKIGNFSGSTKQSLQPEDQETQEVLIRNLIIYKDQMGKAAKCGILELETVKICGLFNFRDSIIQDFEEFKVLNRGKFIHEDINFIMSSMSEERNFYSESSLSNITTNIPIYEDNPVSVIAYCLSSARFQKFLENKNIDSIDKYPNSDFITEDDIYEEKKKSPISIKSDSNKIFQRKNSNSDLKKVQEDIYECIYPPVPSSKSRNISKLEGEIDDKKKLKFKVIIYYPKQFESLREEMGIGKEQFSRSLASSTNWDTSGGKSSASFIKTADEFFVLKGIENKEFRMFKDMAEDYFQYMTECIINDTPTLISKILGMYEVTLGGNTWYYICMENLFYGMIKEDVILQVYDLKGSGTNRYNEKKKSSVLLDTNFKIDRRGMPLLVKEKDHDFLLTAVKNDSDFLEAHSRIDYSLLLIMNEDKGLAKMGIIDYLRIYTWDKQLETGYKRAKKLGAEPTIIPPSEYKDRFIKAMRKYFAGVSKETKFAVRSRRVTIRKNSL